MLGIHLQSVNATASSASTSVADSSSITLRDGERREGVKRRFTEEKDDKLPENLLGYQVSYGRNLIPQIESLTRCSLV